MILFTKPSLIAGLILLSLVSCKKSVNENDHVKSDRFSLSASGNQWHLNAQWAKEGDDYIIEGHHGDLDFSFSIDLTPRSEPFAYSRDDVRMVSHGSYNNSYTFTHNGRSYSSIIEFGRVDLKTEEHFESLMMWPFYSESTDWSLSEDGVYVTVRVEEREDGYLLDIDVLTFTVDGLKLPEELLERYKRGHVILQKVEQV